MKKQCQKVDPEKVLNSKPLTAKVKFTEKDLILYSLGIGFSQDPLKELDYKYTLEFHERFSSFPTYAVVLAPLGMNFLQQNPYIPEFNPYSLLHAEERLTIFHKEFIPQADYQTQIQIVDVQEKGQNAYFTFRTQCFLISNGKKDIVFQIHRKFYIKGLGGFGFKGTGVSKDFESIPKRKSDLTLSALTFSGQAFIYRLSGDSNPLHVDPSASSILKFERPILHGLATYGTIARTIVQNLFHNDPQTLTSFNVRFVGHVYPGESLQIQIWKKQNGYVFQTWTIERKTKCVVGEFNIREIPKL